MSVTIRYFAAAKAALGVAAEERPAGTTIGDLLAAAAADAAVPAEALAVLNRCSFLVNGSATTDRAITLGPGDALDVLPPFAGG